MSGTCASASFLSCAASALAVACAEAGHNTLLVSTDPAHSLGDALAVEMGGGKVVRIEGIAGASPHFVFSTSSLLMSGHGPPTKYSLVTLS